MITALLILFTLPIVYFFDRVVIRYAFRWLDEREWRRLHPGMPSYRRYQS
jgi:hypothetical protein